MNLTDTDFLLIITTFIILLVILMMALVYGVFVKKKSQMLLSQQRADAVYQQELAVAQVEIKEQTINHIGQELHDCVGQKLSVARLMTNKVMDTNEDNKAEIGKEINILLGECIQDIRNLSKVYISSQVTYFGFVESLEREIFRIERLQLMEVDYKINNADLEIDTAHGLILFRIVQECINNVIKHSRSNTIAIYIVEGPADIQISINDEGIGFNANVVNDGSGLKNIKNRAQVINAEFVMKSTEHKGTEISIIYKIKRKNYGNDKNRYS